MDETDGDSYQPPVKKRCLRSSTGFFTSKGKARSPHVLPSICVLCKEDKSITCRMSGKRTKEKLSKCSIIEAHNLLQAAKDNNNTELLLQIQGKDCVAIEVQYHHTCYKNFTRYLSKPLTIQASTSVDTKYSEAYTIFCNTVKTNIIDNKDIYRLTRLNQMFIKQVKSTHNMDASTYKTGNLKTRLMKTFPQLCFLQPQMRSQGHLVYVNDISKEVLVEDRKLLHEVMYSTTDTETDTDTETATSNDEERLPQPISHEQKNLPTVKECNESYMTALNLRNTINDIKPSIPWPPFSEHLTVKAAENIIPPSLYNFIAWTVGASEEPSLDNRVTVPLDTHRKILAISQDIVYLQSKGRKQMPKHMSLAMTVRHLTGSAQLIGLLNGFGYSVSTSVALNHDTAIANQEMSRGDNALAT